MVKSMTGFGRHILINDTAKISVEIRSVNHRYLDLNLKMGHRLLPFESKIRAKLQNRIKRGKVDINISYYPLNSSGDDILYNHALASLYKESILKISEEFNIVNDLTATRLATMRDVLTLTEAQVDEDALWILLDEAIDMAVEDFLLHRKEEGERLSGDIFEKLDALEKLVKNIDDSIDSVMAAYKKKLYDRLTDLLGDTQIDESRLAAEFVIHADKLAIDEELVRLHSHIEAFRRELKKGGDIGRKLDFISQELNREANTILSKTIDPGLSDIGIEIKTLIEKIREQIQNIE